MERIEVRYLPVISENVRTYNHKYVLYTDSNGNKYAGRGGPQNNLEDLSILSGSGAYVLGSNGELLWGDIETAHGQYNLTNFPTDYDGTGVHASELIVEGADLSAQWADITQALDQIEGEGHPYAVSENNSNSVVDEALRRAGLPTPQQDDDGENFSPGSGTGLDGSTTPFPSNGAVGMLMGLLSSAQGSLSYLWNEHRGLFFLTPAGPAAAAVPWTRGIDAFFLAANLSPGARPRR